VYSKVIVPPVKEEEPPPGVKVTATVPVVVPEPEVDLDNSHAFEASMVPPVAGVGSSNTPIPVGPVTTVVYV